MHIWQHATACYRPDHLLIDAYVTCVCRYVGAPLVSAGPAPRVDSASKPACELGGVRLSRGGPHRPHAVGRAHVTCILALKRDNTSATLAPTTPIASQSRRSHKRRADSDPGKQAYSQAMPAEATEQPEDTSWDPTPAELAA